MADEVRRSGRPNKGHHTKNADALDEPLQKSKPKSKTEKKPEPVRAQSTQSGDQQEDEEEEDAIYRCVCGDQREIRGREMIMCDRCEAWQHNKCLNLPDSSYWVDKTYLCEQCKPEDHRELLEAMARGEKPWARKKGSKAAKPKFRPSEGGAGTPDKKKTPQPEPQHTEPSVAAKEESPAQGAQEPAQQTSHDSPSADIDQKPPKRSPSQRAPQSPIAEKRSREPAQEKETPLAKRRKSSAVRQEDTPQQHGVAPSVESLPEKQRLLAESLVKSLSIIIKSAADAGSYRVPDGETPNSVATRFVLQIDHAAVSHYGPPEDNSHPYSERIRRIMFNTRKNAVLVERLLNGSLSPAELSTMPVEEMASEDKQREFAAMKEASERQMILTDEPGPRLRKTHKGEEIVGEDNEVPEVEHNAPPQRHREIEEKTEETSRSPHHGDSEHVVELPDTVERTAALSVDTKSPTVDDNIRRQSTFDINSVFAQVKSPQQDQQQFNRRQSSRPQQTPQEGHNIQDADVDRLLNDDNDVEMGNYSQDPTIVWRGALEMAAFGSFDAVARFVAGGDFGQMVPWDTLLASTLPIEGRIESQKGNGYIGSLPMRADHQLAVLSITPVTPEGQEVFDKIFQYFQPRQRWGVVPVERLPNEKKYMRDLYVVPVEAGGDELPPFLNLLEYCTIESIRSSPMLLLALVAKFPAEAPEAGLPQNYNPYQATPTHQQPNQPPSTQQPPSANGVTVGPSPSPLPNPHAPQYSPMQPVFPPNGAFAPPQHPQPPNQHQHQPPNPNPTNAFSPTPLLPIPQPQTQQPHHRIPKSLEIFGDLIDCPTVTQLLSNDGITEEIMRNLAHIVREYPATRTDMAAMSHHLSQRARETQEWQRRERERERGMVIGPGQGASGGGGGAQGAGMSGGGGGQAQWGGQGQSWSAGQGQQGQGPGQQGGQPPRA
ncbi:hypothetical protein M011DRAFT_527815 [Sporormia fimetaria CBS 119925]|uniref:Transcription factor BYE1 n=1 Tax=Sporormia fimetaria CBS 119925 TaxID=1340428 RepID=A0A6A6V7Q0_9PLEO|nr:hypothetical protein M011DRAFT_527815 [Sporormia fimetaria CBS 119925]